MDTHTTLRNRAVASMVAKFARENPESNVPILDSIRHQRLMFEGVYANMQDLWQGHLSYAARYPNDDELADIKDNCRDAIEGEFITIGVSPDITRELLNEISAPRAATTELCH